MAMAQFGSYQTFFFADRNENSFIEKGIRQMQLYTDLFDVKLMLSNGELIGANKFVLAMYSPVFLNWFKQINCKDDACVVVTGFSHKAIGSIIDLLYNGRVKVNSREVNELKSALNAFQITGVKLSSPVNEPSIAPQRVIDQFNLPAGISISRVNGSPRQLIRQSQDNFTPQMVAEPKASAFRMPQSVLTERNGLKRNIGAPQAAPINEMAISAAVKRTRANVPAMNARSPIVNNSMAHMGYKTPEKLNTSQLMQSPSSVQQKTPVKPNTSHLMQSLSPVQYKLPTTPPSRTVSNVSSPAVNKNGPARTVAQVGPTLGNPMQRNNDTSTKVSPMNTNAGRNNNISTGKQIPAAAAIQVNAPENKENFDIDNSVEYVDNTSTNATIQDENNAKSEADFENNGDVNNNAFEEVKFVEDANADENAENCGQIEFELNSNQEGLEVYELDDNMTNAINALLDEDEGQEFVTNN